MTIVLSPSASYQRWNASRSDVLHSFRVDDRPADSSNICARIHVGGRCDL